MSLKSVFDCARRYSPLTPSQNLEIVRSRAFRVRECRVWRRRRIKTNRNLALVRSHGRIQVRSNGDDLVEERLVYQRVCVTTDDDGVISLGLPANLELKEERGLDTTLLFIYSGNC